ncbi:hypothetical protein AcV5_008969 [Taiwanofungus camphoratus]|nr:hypothetical protein AcV5_008969 [Antrodia cinnamomea]
MDPAPVTSAVRVWVVWTRQRSVLGLSHRLRCNFDVCLYISAGSAAAWAQRVFLGAVVKEDAWFSFLQRAGMKPAMRGSIGKSILDGLAAGARLVGNLFARNGGA